MLKEELKKELNDMGTQLGSEMRDLESWRTDSVEMDDKLSALKQHFENLACLMKNLKEKGVDNCVPL